MEDIIISKNSPGNDETNNYNDNNSNDDVEESNRPACAACKHQRKKCRKGCPFLLHFPASRQREFSAVHQIFGIANVNKMIRGVDSETQVGIVDSIIWEAMIWTNNENRDVGPYGLYRKLEAENKQLREQIFIKSQAQELLAESPHNLGIIGSKLSNHSREVVPNYSRNYNDNLIFNSTVNSYNSLLEGGDHEKLRAENGSIISNGSQSQYFGFSVPPLLPPRPNLLLRPELHMNEENGRSGRAVLPFASWQPANYPMFQAHSTSGGISKFPGPSSPCVNAVEGSRRFGGRYNPFPYPGQYSHPAVMQNHLQNNGHRGGFVLQFPSVNSTTQNNVSDQQNQVNPNAAQEEDDTD